MQLTWRNFSALSEGISPEACRTRADGVVVDHLAVGPDTASSDARVFALLLDASQMSWTFGIDDTLRSTQRRSAGVPRQTGAGLVAVDNLALSVGATG